VDSQLFHQPRRLMDSTEREEIKHMVEDAVTSTLNRVTLPICQVEGARLAQMESVVKQVRETVLGNGHVEGSLIWRQQKTEEAIEVLREILDRRGKEKDPFKTVVYYIVDKILPTLLTSAILGYIALQLALSNLVKP
jgi:hypothetical protein